MENQNAQLLGISLKEVFITATQKRWLRRWEEWNPLINQMDGISTKINALNKKHLNQVGESTMKIRFNIFFLGRID